MRVFLVDDEPEIVDLYAEIIGLCGHEIAGIATNGAQAVTLYETLSPPPDLVLMDHRMPLKTGLEAAREILRAHPEAHIIFVSADQVVAHKARALGAAGFFKKPFTVDRFISILSETQDRLAGKK